jgi:hypothetical protein
MRLPRRATSPHAATIAGARKRVKPSWLYGLREQSRYVVAPDEGFVMLSKPRRGGRRHAQFFLCILHVEGRHVMADLSDLAAQIVKTTRVVSDAKQAVAGKPVSVSVIPGFSPSVPSPMTLTGTLTGTLTPVITAVTITVEYTVADKAGAPVAAGTFSTNPPLPATGGHPLDVDFLLRPPVGDDVERTASIEYVIEVDVTVDVDGHVASTKNAPLEPLKVPVSIPAIGIPAVLVLAQHDMSDARYPGDVLCMVRSASPLRSLDKVVRTLNDVAETVSSLKDILGLVAVANPVEGIDLILNAFRNASIVYFSVGGAPDFNEFGGWDTLGFGGFDDEASSALMFGAAGTRARVWSSEDFKDSDWHEHSTFEVTDIGVANGLPAVGFGLFRNDDFGDWDTDPGDSMHDEIESARFIS